VAAFIAETTWATSLGDPEILRFTLHVLLIALLLVLERESNTHPIQAKRGKRS
jgi:hypothetical protein